MKIIKIIFAIILLSIVSDSWAQEYRMKVDGNKTLKFIEVNRVQVEGHEGNEIVFTTHMHGHRDEERAEGLTAISGLGLTDNSGIGLSVITNENSIEVNQLARRNSNEYVVKIPKNVKVFYKHTGTNGNTFKAQKISSELEVSTNHNGIYMTDVTGPMTLNSVHGKVEVIFSNLNQSSPISILSVHGLVDVTLPSESKVDLRMESDWGELYTDMEIEFDRSEGELRKHSSKVNGKLNGGGVDLHLVSNHGNVYLRKQK